ncbi:MAG: hypothetical protein KUG57_09030 [Ilumatobacteraceae bacterium]|nr:hypothetical protein [Ilumatobacteraceae bacterium]
MFETPTETAPTMECGTCMAAGTAACGDCVVTHLLANDDGPIQFVTVPLFDLGAPQRRAIELFKRAGLVDDPVTFASAEEFEPVARAVACAVP